MILLRPELLVPAPVLFCSGCKRPFEAPTGNKDVECGHCGRPMHVVTIQPAAEAAEAKGG